MTSAAARRDIQSPITVPVPLGDRAYDILVGRGLIETAGSRIAALGARAAAVVTDEHVGPLYADAAAEQIHRGAAAEAGGDPKPLAGRA